MLAKLTWLMHQFKIDNDIEKPKKINTLIIEEELVSSLRILYFSIGYDCGANWRCANQFCLHKIYAAWSVI
jgi:hypothetical protein